MAKDGTKTIDLEKGLLMRRLPYLLVSLALLVLPLSFTLAGETREDVIPPVPTPGMVTMVDIGAHKCIPCKMMAPIIAELQKEYAGRASVIFIDVWEHREQGSRFGIRAIPTQIFYDKAGKEVSRHMGFMDKESIVDVFKQLGVPDKPVKK